MTFGTPANAEGSLHLIADWVILRFDEADAFQMAGSVAGVAVNVEYHNLTRMSLSNQLVTAKYPIATSSNTTLHGISYFEGSWQRLGGYVAIRGPINVEVAGNATIDHISAGDTRKLLTSRAVETGHFSTWAALADYAQPILQVKPAFASVKAMGQFDVEWLGATVSCRSLDCPTGGTLGSRSVSAVELQTLSFERMHGLRGELAGNGTFAELWLGGGEISVQGNGHFRLPNLEGLSCTCSDGSQTLVLDGAVNLQHLFVSDSNLISGLADFHASTRLDETGVILLERLGAPIGAVAGSLVLGLAIKLAVPLFTRLSKKQALEHPNRQKIFQYVQEHPGANFREIARNTQIPAGTVRHHQTVLERSGHLVEHAHNGTVRLFENHGKFDHNWEDMVLLREPPLARVHAWLKAHPNSPQKDILEAFEQEGWSRSTTQHRLSRLVEGGLATIRLQGRLKIYAATERTVPKAPFFLQPGAQTAA